MPMTVSDQWPSPPLGRRSGRTYPLKTTLRADPPILKALLLEYSLAAKGELV